MKPTKTADELHQLITDKLGDTQPEGGFDVVPAEGAKSWIAQARMGTSLERSKSLQIIANPLSLEYDLDLGT